MKIMECFKAKAYLFSVVKILNLFSKYLKILLNFIPEDELDHMIRSAGVLY